ncbi:MAG: cytochrome b N-terminal domain-containing protein, partial [Acidimicrobiales bacterium]
TNPGGHFYNSLHLWSVELFMAFMVIHLWGKFWMAAWRGRRALTWITGVVAFAASVVECFTGYLSQQNFDSQWISTNGKDAINATGLGAFFNLMNFGQMLVWHVVLIPIVLMAIVGAHVLLVRVRGVSHPLPARRARGRAERRAAALADATEWRGPTRRYDIVKEATVASMIALVLVVLLAGLLSSPDAPPVTVASWAKVAPADFMATAASELAGTSETAAYGPPYNHGSSNVQRIGVSWQLLAGVREPIDPAQTFVLSPLSRVAPTDPSLARALDAYQAAGAAQRQAWSQAYLKAVDHVTFRSGTPVVPVAADGPVPILVSTELTLARSGALDADLLAQQPFYGSNFTKPLLFLEDGSYYASQATAAHLTGNQWGVMNETGSYPGQPWLWLYQLWYQVPGFKTSANVDLIAIYLTGVATLLLLAVPFLPGLRDIPRVIPLHRLVWRHWNHSEAGNRPATPSGPPATPSTGDDPARSPSG